MVRFGESLSESEIIENIRSLYKTKIGKELLALRNELSIKNSGKEINIENIDIEQKSFDICFEYYAVLIKRKKSDDINSDDIKQKIQELNNSFDVWVRIKKKFDLDKILI